MTDLADHLKKATENIEERKAIAADSLATKTKSELTPVNLTDEVITIKKSSVKAWLSKKRLKGFAPSFE